MTPKLMSYNQIDFQSKFHLEAEIKRIEKKFNFIIEDHRLELFGKCTDLCKNCI